MAWFRGSGSNREAAGAGVLLVNLGTPAAPSYAAVRRFLGNFLSDRRVIEASPAYWYPLLYGPVLAVRPLRTARLYRAIWTPAGSPLFAYSLKLATRLQTSYGVSPGAGSVRVALAMTYGEPAIATAVANLLNSGIRKLVVLPLYPQYSGTTTGAVFDVVTRELKRWRRVPEFHFIADYHDEPAYIEALASGVREVWRTKGRSHLLLSNHGLPIEYAKRGDPYPAQVEATSLKLAAALGLTSADFSQSFQSRFGPAKWLQPYTDERLVALARSGVHAVTVTTPSFAVDCLETLEEIAIGSRAKFLAAGGTEFNLVPALNDSDAHVHALRAVLRRAGVDAAPV